MATLVQTVMYVLDWCWCIELDIQCVSHYHSVQLSTVNPNTGQQAADVSHCHTVTPVWSSSHAALTWGHLPSHWARTAWGCWPLHWTAECGGGGAPGERARSAPRTETWEGRPRHPPGSGGWRRAECGGQGCLAGPRWADWLPGCAGNPALPWAVLSACPAAARPAGDCSAGPPGGWGTHWARTPGERGGRECCAGCSWSASLSCCQCLYHRWCPVLLAVTPARLVQLPGFTIAAQSHETLGLLFLWDSRSLQDFKSNIQIS